MLFVLHIWENMMGKYVGFCCFFPLLWNSQCVKILMLQCLLSALLATDIHSIWKWCGEFDFYCNCTDFLFRVMRIAVRKKSVNLMSSSALFPYLLSLLSLTDRCREVGQVLCWDQLFLHNYYLLKQESSVKLHTMLSNISSLLCTTIILMFNLQE